MKKLAVQQGSNLPNLIIIGAMKSGTSSLHSYLSLHPQISMSSQKELRFFSNDQIWRKGTDWYRSNFLGEALVHGESSPQYTYYPYFKDVPDRIYSVVPETKLIYILRDPVERIISHYTHWYASGLESRSLSEVFQDLESSLTQRYIWYSQYNMQLEQYLKRFKLQNILVLTLEKLHNQRIKTLQKAFRFLGVDESFLSPRFYEVHHQSEKKKRPNTFGLAISKSFTSKLPLQLRYRVDNWLVRPFSCVVQRPLLDDPTREIIYNHLQKDIYHLRKTTGLSFPEWNV